MKVSGAELIAFMDKGWPKPDDDWYWDRDLFDNPDPSATYDTDEIGPIYFQGGDVDPTRGQGHDVAALIRRWRRDRDCEVFCVTVPRDKADEAKEALKALGATVQ